jgi:hypothetical protein
MFSLPNPWQTLKRARRRGAAYLTNGLLVPIIAFGTVAAQPALLARAADGDPPPINLAIDNDRDGVPDELSLAVQTVLSAEGSEAQTTALADLYKRLPYSEETRALQDKAGQLQQELEATEDPKQAEQLIEEIRTLGERMNQDEQYVATMKALDILFKPDESMGGDDEPRLMAVPWNQGRAGDVLGQLDMFSFLTYVYVMNYGHTGNCYNDGCGQILESLSDGVILRSRTDQHSVWQGWGKKIIIMRNNQVPPPTVVAKMVARANRHVNRTPYNYNLVDKWTDSKLYCSQLTWKIHKDAGVDLDSNHPAYSIFITLRWGWAAGIATGPAVAPDEVVLSPKLNIVGWGWT